MTWVKPRVTIPDARPYGDDRDPATGVFVFPSDVRVEIETRTKQFFESSGETAVILEWLADQAGVDLPGTGLRQTLAFDFGSGTHAVTLDFRSFTGSEYRWGDSGNGGTKGDASVEDVFSQMSVLDRYIQTATLDSENPAILEVAEYSEEGRYGPLAVMPENPTLSFDSQEQSSTFDGSITWIETLSLEQVIDGRNQRG